MTIIYLGLLAFVGLTIYLFKIYPKIPSKIFNKIKYILWLLTIAIGGAFFITIFNIDDKAFSFVLRWLVSYLFVLWLFRVLIQTAKKRGE